MTPDAFIRLGDAWVRAAAIEAVSEFHVICTSGHRYPLRSDQDAASVLAALHRAFKAAEEQQ